MCYFIVLFVNNENPFAQKKNEKKNNEENETRNKQSGDRNDLRTSCEKRLAQASTILRLFFI